MILERLTLHDFGLFAGEQAFDLRPGRRNGRHLPIVLFGGINGGGKTTLLDAIQLALYGGRARCSKRSQLSYEEFLRASIHHGPAVDAADTAGVALSFRHAADGVEHLYDVRRRWRLADGKVREELRVDQDGLPDAWLSENWPQLVEELLPLDISQLFFFDAEKIRTLAEDEGSSKALGAAIKSLLGLDIVERLITDSTVLQARLAKRLGTPEHRAQVEALEQAVQGEQARLDAVTTERAGLENHLLRGREEQKEAEAAFAAAGGRHYQAREKREERLVEVRAMEDALRGQLVALAAGDLPLALVPDLLTAVQEQDRRECEAHDAEVIGRLLLERDHRVLAALQEARASPALLRRIADLLEADCDARRPAEPVPRRLDLAEPDRALLRHLREHRLADLQAQARQLLDKLARTVREREELERAVAAAPDDADIRRLMDRLTAAAQHRAVLEAQAGQLDEAREAQRQKVDEQAARLRKLWQGQLSKEFACEDARRMIELAGRTRETMQVFLGKVTARKIDRLSAFVTESFRFLLRKQTLVERIHIDPATFAITLDDDGAGRAIAKERLSEGEKQIFAIAVLWGLARASARPLPAVIDTPMARLDAAHRRHLVERYFPSASHQVVLFSTDTEVDRHYYQALQPAIARAYHLSYDEVNRRTVGEEGYFWRE
jgi:DNA sulfur modification protein DndD